MTLSENREYSFGIATEADNTGEVWEVVAGPERFSAPEGTRQLYTAEQRRRRDNSRWTIVQGVLAPLQFLVFLVSLALIFRYLSTGEGLFAANSSIVAKTMVLYAIMITGSIWEKDVFGKWLFADAFFWEDMVSMLVLALHTAYLVCLLNGLLEHRALMLLALAAYGSYAINAAQFLLKLRAARLGASMAGPLEPAS